MVQALQFQLLGLVMSIQAGKILYEQDFKFSQCHNDISRCGQ